MVLVMFCYVGIYPLSGLCSVGWPRGKVHCGSHALATRHKGNLSAVRLGFSTVRCILRAILSSPRSVSYWPTPGELSQRRVEIWQRGRKEQPATATAYEVSISGEDWSSWHSALCTLSSALCAPRACSTTIYLILYPLSTVGNSIDWCIL